MGRVTGHETYLSQKCHSAVHAPGLIWPERQEERFSFSFLSIFGTVLWSGPPRTLPEGKGTWRDADPGLSSFSLHETGQCGQEGGMQADASSLDHP